MTLIQLHVSQETQFSPCLKNQAPFLHFDISETFFFLSDKEMGGTLRDVPSFLWPDARLNEKRENMGVPQDSTEKTFAFRIQKMGGGQKSHIESGKATMNICILTPNLISAYISRQNRGSRSKTVKIDYNTQMKGNKEAASTFMVNQDSQNFKEIYIQP